MTVYYGVYFLTGIITFLLSKVRMDEVKRRKAICIFCFVPLFLVLALRHPSMGVDLAYGLNFGYLGNFSRITEFSWAEVFTRTVMNYERGYIVFNKLISVISSKQQSLIISCTFFSLLSTAYVIYKKSASPVFSMYIYMGLPIFILLFSGMRQALAISICFYSILFIQKKRPIRFAILVFLAATFHYTATIFLISYPLYHLKIKRLFQLGTALLLPILFIFRSPIFMAWSRTFKANAIADNNGAVTLFIVFSLVYVFCLAFTGGSKEENGLLNIFLIACCVQALAGVYSTAMRVGYYFMYPILLLVPQLIQKAKNKRDALILKTVIGACFIVFGLHSLRTSSFAQSYPHYWFWNIF